MPYSNVLLKGRIGYNTYGWPLIIMERAKSDAPTTPVMCEVFGVAHECGSIYAKEILLPDNKATELDIIAWKKNVSDQGHNPEKRYFKGQLI